MGFATNSKPPCPSRPDAPLGALTTFGMGGKAALLVEPRNRDELVAALRALRGEGVPFRMLGGGANVLVDDRGVAGAVVLTSACSFIVREDEPGLRLRLSAGVSIPRFVVHCSERGLTGAECLVGVPGTIGGATVMNAGGRHGWLSSIVRRVRFLTPDLEEEEIEVGPETFGYRRSIFGDCVVLETVVEVAPAPREAVQGRVKTILREKRDAQPLTEKSAGCIFQNAPDVSAGKLLERAGVKGLRVGDAQVSEKHANFVVNRGGARFSDVIELIERARTAVLEQSGVRLETEVKIWEGDG